MELLTSLLASLAAAGGLCVYVGWGALRLALPPSLQPQRALLLPLAGFALAIWCGYLAVITVLNLRWALLLLFLLSSALNLVAWRLGGRPRPLAALRRHAPELALTGLTLLIGLLPLISFGYLTIIGRGWDTEVYLPLAAHLIDYPLLRLRSDAPIGPLRELIYNPSAISLSLGFTIFQGLSMLLSGQSALQSFAALLALLRALGVLAVYLWLHSVMGLQRRAALLGSGLTAAGALLLWVSFFNFGAQLAAWPLIPLSALIGLATVEYLAQPQRASAFVTPALRMSFASESGAAAWFSLRKLAAALLAGICLAGLAVAYYPALAIAVALCAGLGLARLLEALRMPQAARPLALLLAASGLALAVLVLAAPTLPDYFDGFSFRYGLQSQHAGVNWFIPLSDTLGLSAFHVAGPNADPQPPALLRWLGALVAGGLMLAAFLPWPGMQQPVAADGARPGLRWFLTLLLVAAYLAWLRFGYAYAYGYMKSSAYIGFVLWGLAAFGWQRLMQLPVRLRVLPALAALLALLATGWSQLLVLREHMGAPPIFTRDLTAFEPVARQLPPGATVAISSDASLAGPINGMLGSMLYGREVWGHLVLAYTGYDYWPEGLTPQYMLLAATEQPWPLELGAREVWRSAALALYELPAQLRWRSGRSEWYSSAAPADRRRPAQLAIWRRGGPLLAGNAEQPLILLPEALPASSTAAPGATPVLQVARIRLASLTAQQVQLQIGDQTTPIALLPGLNQVGLPLQNPTRLQFAAEDTIALLDAQLLPAPAPSAPVQVATDTGMLIWQAQSELAGEQIAVRIAQANPGRHALRVELTLVENSFVDARRIARVLSELPINRSWELSLDLRRGASEARVDGRPTPMLAAELAPVETGEFFAVITLYAGAEPLVHQPLFRVWFENGTPTRFEPVPYSLEATRVSPLATAPLHIRRLLEHVSELDAHGLQLEYAALQRLRPAAGLQTGSPVARTEPLRVTLLWHAITQPVQPLMVSVQLLDQADRKWAQWDGPLGGDWRPLQSWSPGERMRQDVPLSIDPATPAGRYRLLLVVYDPLSGAAQSFAGQGGLLLGEIEIRADESRLAR